MAYLLEPSFTTYKLFFLPGLQAEPKWPSIWAAVVVYYSTEHGVRLDNFQNPL